MKIKNITYKYEIGKLRLKLDENTYYALLVAMMHDLTDPAKPYAQEFDFLSDQSYAYKITTRKSEGITTR